jgi:hypothetical protein
MNKPHRSVPSDAQTSESKSFILGFWRIRYQVEDVNRSVDFFAWASGLTTSIRWLSLKSR